MNAQNRQQHFTDVGDLELTVAPHSPVFVWRQRDLRESASVVERIVDGLNCRALYSVKACSIHDVLEAIAENVQGFACSSLFEVRLAQKFTVDGAGIHYASPLLRENEVGEVIELCDRISLNSLSQFDRFGVVVADGVELGLRLNPGLSSITDKRYDPCRRNSKLGIPLDSFAAALSAEPERFARVSGLHFHSNCDSDDLGEWVKVIRHVESALGDDLRRFRWLNVGGGYSFEDEEGLRLLRAEFERLTSTYGLEIVIEPGAALVRSAGYFVSTVHDIVPGDDYPIAILDLSVNHWPEVFEYQFEPDVEGHVEGAPHTYLLAGCSCLAGDLFGVYSFEEPLDIGSRVVFKNAGAYSIVKAHMFNGINLPSIYVVRETGEVEPIREFTYEDFLARCGKGIHEPSGT